MKWSVRVLRVEEFENWNMFVDKHPEGTVFHKTNWLGLINPQIVIYVVSLNQEIIAGVALIKTKKNGVSGYHIPPYTQYFSPLYGGMHNYKGSLAEEHECIKAVLEEIKGVNHIDFKLPKGHQSILPYHWKGFDSSVVITHTISLTLENYLNSLNINKARELKKLLLLVNSGEITINDEINPAELTHLLQKTSERKGFDAKPELVCELVMKADPTFAKKIVIRSKKYGLIAFGFFPYDDKAVYNLVNASVSISDPVLKTINLLLLYQAIEFALNSRRIFDFEGSMLPSVEAFCRLMGGTQVPIYRVQKSPSLSYSLLRAVHQIKNDRKKT